MKIDTEGKLRVHLKLLEKRLLKEGCDKMQIYPVFCIYYDKNKEKYPLPKEQVFDTACEILIEED
jgi:hypothetical protein